MGGGRRGSYIPPTLGTYHSHPHPQGYIIRWQSAEPWMGGAYPTPIHSPLKGEFNSICRKLHPLMRTLGRPEPYRCIMGFSPSKGQHHHFGQWKGNYFACP